MIRLLATVQLIATHSRTLALLSWFAIVKTKQIMELTKNPNEIKLLTHLTSLTDKCMQVLDERKE